jgi:hypothetical protein
MRKIIATVFATLSLGVALAGASVAPASADPITCPPGQAATLNPSGGGWICVNYGGNTNHSEDPKGKF